MERTNEVTGTPTQQYTLQSKLKFNLVKSGHYSSKCIASDHKPKDTLQFSPNQPSKNMLAKSMIMSPVTSSDYEHLLDSDIYQSIIMQKKQLVTLNEKLQQQIHFHHKPSEKSRISPAESLVRKDSSLYATSASRKQHNRREGAHNYTMIKLLGSGSNSSVYLAKNKENGFLVAMKVIPKKALNSIKQFIREITLHSELSHPSIISYYSCFEDEGNIYIIQEFACGGHIFAKLKRVGQFSEVATSFVARHILQAVQYLHMNKIIHRDIKPENIIISHGCIKLCDLGWAVKSEQLRNTICGTPLYSSPELLSGFKYSEKIDLWAIGVLTYELFYGTVPFGITNKYQLVKIINQQIMFPEHRQASEDLKDFIGQLLKKNPKERLTAEILLLHPFILNHLRTEICQQLYDQI